MHTHCMHRPRPPSRSTPPLALCSRRLRAHGPGACHAPSPRRRVFWLAAAAGYSVDFAAIVMHAVATNDESFGKPCLYCQLDSEEEGEGGLGGSGSEEEEGAEGGAGSVLPELRLIPADAEQRECAVLAGALHLAWLHGGARLQESGSLKRRPWGWPGSLA